MHIHLHDRINSYSTLYGKGSVDIRSNHVRYWSLLEVYLVGSWHDGEIEYRLSGAGSFGRAEERGCVSWELEISEISGRVLFYHSSLTR